MISGKMGGKASHFAKRLPIKVCLPVEGEIAVSRKRRNRKRVINLLSNFIQESAVNDRACFAERDTRFFKNVSIFFTTAANINGYNDSLGRSTNCQGLGDSCIRRNDS